jgi:hypothetical protein
MRITFETPGQRLVDIVDSKKEVKNDIYILKEDLPLLVYRCNELGIESITKKTFKLLRFEKLIKKRKINVD